PFVIHRDLLTHYSPFFAAALKGNFAEAETQKVNLPDERVDTFEIFVEWLYSQRLDTTAPPQATGPFLKDGKPAFFSLLHLYSLADRLCIEDLRNDIVDAVATLAERANAVPTPSDTHLLYVAIRPSAPLRALVLDLFAFKKTDALLATHPD
ncbi:hypothetical protein BDY21DRAFT_275119, partial [Lineolata rhizophorae]